MNIPLEVAQAQGNHGIKGAAHGVKGGRPPLNLSFEERTERRHAQQIAYRRRKGIPERSTITGKDRKYFAIWGKMPGEPLTPEEYAEREPFWLASIKPGQEAERQKQLKLDERLEERLQCIEQYDLLNEILKSHYAPNPIGRNEPCPCGSGRKFKKCCGG